MKNKDEKQEDYEKVLINEYRNYLINMLCDYRGDVHIKLDVSKSFFNKILFRKIGNYKIFAIPFELAKKLDLSDADFNGVNIIGLNFRGSYGVKINPQNIAGEILEKDNILYWVNDNKYRIDSFGDKDTVDAFLQIKHSLNNCVFDGVKFIGPFDNSLIRCSNFSGSKFAKINPETLVGDLYIINKKMDVEKKRIMLPLTNCVFKDVEFCGNFDDTVIYNSNFKGSNGANIDLSRLKKFIIDNSECIPINGCDFSDTDISELEEETGKKLILK